MDLVVIAGTIGRDAAWTRGCPRALLPLPAGNSLLDALLDRFESLPGAVSAVCANGQTELIAAHTAGRRSKRQLVLFEDGVPRGAAGCLRACAPLLTSDAFFVSCGSVWLDDDPEWMLARHRAGDNALTVFCTRDPSTEGLVPSGVYCCQREALDCVRPTGYQDLKEQWVPALQEAGLRVGAVVLRGGTRHVVSWSHYLSVVEESLLADGLCKPGYRELAPGIWCGEDVRVAPSVRLVGPVVLGRGCVVDEHAVVLGPTVLGDGSQVGRGAMVIRVIAPARVEITGGAAVVDRLVPLPLAAATVPRSGLVVERRKHSRLAIRVTPEDLRNRWVPENMQPARHGAPSSIPTDPI